MSGDEIKSPWEVGDSDFSSESVPSRAGASVEYTPPKSSGVSEDSWMLGAGFDTSMDGDPNPNEGNNLRFWMPKGTSRDIIFVTEGSEAKVIWEHAGQINGSWKNWATCLEPLGLPCPMCHYSNTHGGAWRRYKGRFFTIIDCASFKDRIGRERKNERRLLCAKKDTSDILQRKFMTRRDAGQGLRGALFKVFRPDSEKSSSVGEDYEFIKMVNLNDYPFSADPNKGYILPEGHLDIGRLLKPDPNKMKIMHDRLTGSPEGVSSRSVGGPDGPGAHIVSY